MNAFEIAAHRFGEQSVSATTDLISVDLASDRCPDDLVPSMPLQGLEFGCQGCHCHDFEAGIHWCYDRQARKFRNVAFIKACPLRQGG